MLITRLLIIERLTPELIHEEECHVLVVDVEDQVRSALVDAFWHINTHELRIEIESQYLNSKRQSDLHC